MGLIASSKGGTPAPAGTHLAVSCQLIDMGTQHSDFYNKDAKKVLIGWELCNEAGGDGKPFLVWKRYTLSLNKKAALRLDLESWRGRKFTDDELKGFDLNNVLDKPCMISIVHQNSDGETYANVNAVMAIPKGTTVPPRINDLVKFDIDDWNETAFATFGDNLKKKILSSKEAIDAGRGSAVNGGTAQASDVDVDGDDPIPF